MNSFNISRRIFLKTLGSAVLATPILSNKALAYNRAPEIIKPKFPNPDGYITLLADLHQHTVFSDGNVWPATRVEEAAREGLDVISITDHIEYTPHKQDIPVDYSRAYKVAKPVADNHGLLIIPGLEITRGRQNTTGADAIRHINCLFLKDFDALNVPNMKDAVYAAAAQDAYIFWNHPAWAQVDHKSVWYPEMDEFIEKGVLKGFEVTNGTDFQPDVIEWCQKHNLTMHSNTDLHNASYYSYGIKGRHRPMTLIFAKDRTLDSVKEAMIAGRTAVYCYEEDTDILAGNEIWLKQIFNNGVSIHPKTDNGDLVGKKVTVTIKNTLPLPLIVKNTAAENINVPANIQIPARGEINVDVTPKASDFKTAWEIQNFYVGKNKPLTIDIA